MKFFDHIFLVTNDLTYDRRVHRIISTLLDHDRSVLLIGRKHANSSSLSHRAYAQHRVTCWFNTGMSFYIEFVIRVMILIVRHYRARYITCNDIDTLLIGVGLKLLYDVQFYLDCHEWFEEVPELNGRIVKKWIWQCVTQMGLGKTDVRYTVNREIADQLCQKYCQEFEVVRNIESYTGMLEWSKKKPIDMIKLVYLGVLNVGRGLEEIIQCMPSLQRVELHIIGDGIIMDQLITLVDHNAATDRIYLHGSLSPEEFGPMLSEAHIGLNLLVQESKSYYYSLANKIFDYLNHGLVVLSMNYPAYRRMARDCSMIYLVDQMHPDEIIHRIQTIIKQYDIATVQQEHQRMLLLWNWETEKLKVQKMYGLNRN